MRYVSLWEFRPIAAKLISSEIDQFYLILGDKSSENADNFYCHFIFAHVLKSTVN